MNKLFGVIVSAALLSGCAFTVHDLPVNYQYSGQSFGLEGHHLPSISIGEINDNRNVENPKMIMHQINGYGQTTTGGWQAEKALSLIVKDALIQAIDAQGLNDERPRNVILEGDLVDVSSKVVSGWASGTINMKVTVKLTARDHNTNKILWRDTIFGDGTSGKESSIKPAILKAFNASLNDMVSKLFTDEYFRQQVLDQI